MSVLEGFRVMQVGPGLAAAVCGRLFRDVGAAVGCIDVDRSTTLAEHLNAATTVNHGIETADLIVCEGSPATLRRTGRTADRLHRLNPTAAVVLISPFGQSGPRAEDPATDLTLCFASGIARMLIGQVDDLDEPPMRPAGEQSAFIGGLAAACAGMHAALLGNGAVIDVAIHEALATLAITELARAGQTGKSWSRKRVADGNGATVCILPARDGYVAISPREDRQWAAWLRVMDSPAWSAEARFASKKDRVANWDGLHALMSDWSRGKTRRWIAESAQAAHVPSFPLYQPADHLLSPQLRHRDFFRSARVRGHPVQVPGSPFGLRLTTVNDRSRIADRSSLNPGVTPTVVAAPAAASAAAGSVPTGPVAGPGLPPLPEDPASGRQTAAASSLPLAGIRVLDFSWVIAGPTATRYLAAMGAEVIKIEAPTGGDPGRTSELHSVLGQAKQGIVLDLKNPEAIVIAKALASNADVLVENFATGVMERLGLGAEVIRAANPDLIYVSASGLGRTGPQAHAVAYGTLLQCYAGFAGLNCHLGLPPRVGMAWLDPMCGLMLAFIVAASLWRRRSGAVARVDFSMLEAMLWTMAEPLLSAQLPGERSGPDTGAVYRCAGADEWLAAEPEPASPATDPAAAGQPIQNGTPAAALARSSDLVNCEHLRTRGFWDPHGAGVLPGLPWHASFGRACGRAPELGGDTAAVLREVIGTPEAEILRLRDAGVVAAPSP